MKCAEGGGRSGPLRSRPLRHRRRRDECGRNLCESMVMGLLLRRATTAEVGEEEGMACFPRSHYNDNVVGGRYRLYRRVPLSSRGRGYADDGISVTDADGGEKNLLW